MSRVVEVWDKPTRIFKWSFALCVAAALITAGGRPEQHVFFGYAVAGLLAFRLVWGVIGSQTARFSQFLGSPAAALAIARGAPHRGWGHNPLAGWAVVALLGCVAWVTATGLALGDAPTAAALAAHAQASNVLTVLLALHVASIFAYLVFRNENLIGPMVSGVKPAPDDAPPAPTIRRDRAALIAGAACASLALALWAA